MSSLISGSASSFFSGNVEILVVAKTKLDVSFATAQFSIPSFHYPVWLNIHCTKNELFHYRFLQ